MDTSKLEKRLAERIRLGMDAAQFNHYAMEDIRLLRQEKQHAVAIGLASLARSNDDAKYERVHNRIKFLDGQLVKAIRYAVEFGALPEADGNKMEATLLG